MFTAPCVDGQCEYCLASMDMIERRTNELLHQADLANIGTCAANQQGPRHGEAVRRGEASAGVSGEPDNGVHLPETEFGDYANVPDEINRGALPPVAANPVESVDIGVLMAESVLQPQYAHIILVYMCPLLYVYPCWQQYGHYSYCYYDYGYYYTPVGCSTYTEEL